MTTTVNGAGTGAELTTRSCKVRLDRRARAERAAVVIEELTRQRIALPVLSVEAPEVEWRDLAVRQALTAARLAGWWRVLARTTAWGEVPEVFRTAAYSARYTELEQARESVRLARFWADRVAAEGSGGVSR